MYLRKSSNVIGISLFLYISLLIGFYFGENSSGGAYQDFIARTEIIKNFKDDFLNTFLNYDNFPDRHSPIIHISFSLLNNLGLDMSLIRFLHLNLLPLLIFMFYKCLQFVVENMIKKTKSRKSKKNEKYIHGTVRRRAELRRARWCIFLMF